tara:strand:- start:139 stop:498 length:360 start_codon:yes stop_codon:yes gene_type:complete
MKKLLEVMVLGLLLSSKSYAESNCLKMLNGYVPEDNMIKLAYLTKKSLTFYINNIRNMKDIDIKGHGFDDNLANQIEKSYNCPKTKFVKAYNRYGIPNPFKINGKLLKDYANQVIVIKK